MFEIRFLERIQLTATSFCGIEQAQLKMTTGEKNA
jgi:hypothetical protein